MSSITKPNSNAQEIQSTAGIVKDDALGSRSEAYTLVSQRRDDMSVVTKDGQPSSKGRPPAEEVPVLIGLRWKRGLAVINCVGASAVGWKHVVQISSMVTMTSFSIVGGRMKRERRIPLRTPKKDIVVEPAWSRMGRLGLWLVILKT